MFHFHYFVATVLTVYGIETQLQFINSLFIQVATVLTVYGIETYGLFDGLGYLYNTVTTVLTACGIETNFAIKLAIAKDSFVTTVLTACGIETLLIAAQFIFGLSYNSTYRLRY